MWKLSCYVISTVLIGLVSSQMSSKCGDGNACFCSQSTNIITCVDSDLVKVPSFSNYVRQWVKRLNLRFNYIVDLGKVLNQEFPKLEIIDVRNNDAYICGDIHELILKKGIIVESNCNEKTETVEVVTPPISTLPEKEPEEELTTESTTINVTTTIDVTGKIGCECNFKFAISLSAVISTIITSIIGFLARLIYKKFRHRFNLPNIDTNFDAERPPNSRPRIQLFTDLSQHPSTSTGRRSIYIGPPRPDLTIQNPSYKIDTSDEDSTYEVPIPQKPRRKSSASSIPPTSPPPPPPSSSIKHKTNISRPGNSPPTAPLPDRPGSVSTSSPRGRARGRGKCSVSKNVDDSPAKNTRSQSKQTIYTSHM